MGEEEMKKNYNLQAEIMEITLRKQNVEEQNIEGNEEKYWAGNL